MLLNNIEEIKSENVATKEDTEAILHINRVMRKIITGKITKCGFKAIKQPKLIATPFPPLKSENIENT